MLNGANMNWLGKREPEFYGTRTLAEVNELVAARAAERDCAVEFFQSNVEGLAMDRIYAAAEAGIDGLLMNPAGFSHAGYALRDCLRAVQLPYVEVHMSNTEARGIDPVTTCEAAGVIAGLGTNSYLIGLDALLGVIAAQHEGA